MKKVVNLIILATFFTGVFLCISNELANASEVAYYLYNAPGGSVTSLTAVSQEPLASYAYKDFGTPSEETEAISNAYKYNGEQQEKDTGLTFLRNRYYAPDLGRFITKDSHPGIEHNPQSLNPYVYCKNNPINYKDPDGEIAAPIVAGGLALWDVFTYWAAESYYNWRYGVNVTSHEVYAEKATWGIVKTALSPFIPTPFKTNINRFSYYATESTMKYSHYSALSTTLSSASKSLFLWSPLKTALSYTGSLVSSLRSAFGGVSLSKTAELMLNINDVAGATYDEATGQIILFGKENLSLPQMDIDDLSVAVNSVYSGNDPGVSIGTEPSEYPGWMKVRYDGATIDTQFGKVMFDADRLLKCLSLGYDNVTGQTVTSSVSGYYNMIYRELYGTDPAEGQTETAERMWFKPKDIKLTKNTTGDAMVFSEVTMELLTEATMQGAVIRNPEGEAFASHFTSHYDDFANEFPVLKDLKKLGKITSIVKWIRDNNIPLDMSFLNDYTPEYVPTERYTPEISVTGTRSWTEGYTTYTRTITMRGGVSYEPPNEYLADDPIDPVTEGLRSAAIAQRPNEETFSWDFQGPPGSGSGLAISQTGDDFKAVSHSVAKSRKDGNFETLKTDMSFPVTGQFNLELTRYYNSFNEKKTGFGYGWSPEPYEMRFPQAKRLFSFGQSGYQRYCYYKINVIDRINNQEDEYTLLGIDNNNLPIYTRPGSVDLLRENDDATFTLNRMDKSIINFAANGRISALKDRNNNTINFNYNSGNLASLSHPNGRTIALTYNISGRIERADGPGGLAVTYTYDGQGNLVQANDIALRPEQYSYNTDHQITTITDKRANPAQENTYDIYNRATQKIIGGDAAFASDFSLKDRMTLTTGPDGIQLEEKFDAEFRPVEQKDALKNLTQIEYEGDFGPKAIKDGRGLISQYRYDIHGNVTEIKNDKGETIKLYYDYKDNLIARTDPEGFSQVYWYDENNNLVTIYNYALLFFDDQGNLTSFSYDPGNISHLNYDSQGNPISITDAEGHTQNLSYDSNGMITGIERPSGLAITQTYDNLSRLSEIRDAAGHNVSFGYDSANNLTSVTTSAGTVSYQYDENDNLITIIDPVNPGQPTHFGYDAKNNLTSVIDGRNNTTTYTYDVFNNLNKASLPNGAQFKYMYDENNRKIAAITAYSETTALTPEIVVIPSDVLDFGRVDLGSSSTKVLKIYNIGLGDLVISNIYTGAPMFDPDFTGPMTIPSGEERDISITFTPNNEGPITDLLTVVSNDSDEGMFMMNLEGSAGRPAIQNLQATPAAGGIQLTWDQYNDPTGYFNHFNIYRDTSSFTNVTGMAPLNTSITDVTTTTYTDGGAESGIQYYYAVTAVDVGEVENKEVEPAGPVTYFSNFDHIGDGFGISGTANNEKNSSIAYNSTNNEYLVVFEYEEPDGIHYDIKGQRLSSTGAMIGGLIDIATFSGEDERRPHVVYNPTRNEYFVVYEYYWGSYGRYFVIADRFSYLGVKQTAGQIVFPPDYGYGFSQLNPRAAYNSTNDQYLVVFEVDYFGDGSDLDVLWQVMSGVGDRVGGPYGIGFSGLQERKPDVAYNSTINEYYMILALDFSGTETDYDIFGLRIGPTGASPDWMLWYVGGWYPIQEHNPRIVYNSANNKYFCTFEVYLPIDGIYNYYLVGQHMAPSGPKDGDWQFISLYVGVDERRPSLAYNSVGNEYLAVCESELFGDNTSIIPGRRISATGDLIGAVVVGAYEGNNNLYNPSIAYNSSDNQYTVTMDYDNGNLGTDFDVIGQRVGAESPVLHVEPSSLDFGTLDVTKQISITNTGTGFLDWGVYPDHAWMTASPKYGNTSTETDVVNINVNRVGLAPGTYNVFCEVRSDGGIIQLPATVVVQNSPPLAPTNPLPQNGATNQSGATQELKITLSWTSGDPDPGDTALYDVYLSNDQLAVLNKNPSALVSLSQAPTSYTTQTLDYSSIYYWRIIAKDNRGGQTDGAVWNFTTISAQTPVLIPYLPDPTNNVRPTLDWYDISGASRYHIQVDDNVDFSSPIVDDPNVSVSQYTSTLDLPEGVIYWRVASVDSEGTESIFSNADNFTIDTTALVQVTLIPYSPDPTNNQRPTLTWNSVAGAEMYHIQVSASSDFAAPLVDKYTAATQWAVTTDLPEGVIWWRVSAKDLAGNDGLYSVPDSFTIDITPPESISIISADSDFVKITVTWNQFMNTGGDFTHFNIYRENFAITNVSGLTPINQSITDSNVTSFIDTTVQPNTAYFYAVTAVDTAGNENRNVASFGPVSLNGNTPPYINPDIPNITVPKNTVITVDLTPYKNDYEEPAQNLIWSISGVNESLFSASINTQTDELTITPVADATGSDNVILTLIDSGGLTDTQSVTIIVSDFTPPTVDYFRLYDFDTSSQIYTNSRDVGVIIYESSTGSAIAKWLINESANQPLSTDFSLTSRPSTYHIQGPEGQRTVYAWVMDGNSNISVLTGSSIYTITLDLTAPKLNSTVSVIDATHIELTYDEPVLLADVASNYAINGLTINSVNKINDTTYRLQFTETQVEGQDYTVTVSNVTDIAGNLIDEAGNTASFKGFDRTAPVFEGLASCAPQDEAVILSWRPATDPTGPVKYNIYQSETQGGQNFSLPRFVTYDTRKKIEGLFNGREYFFVVRAEDAAGNEDTNLIELSATPTASVNLWSQNGLSGETVQCFALDEVAPSNLYAGTLASGIYKSVDSGTTWQQDNSGITDSNIESLAIDPANHEILYAGAGSTSYSNFVYEDNLLNGTSQDVELITNPPPAVLQLSSGPDPQSVLLLHLNGENGATSTIDSSISNNPITFNGNAHLDTLNTKFGSAALALDGNGDYLTIPDSEDWNLGNGDFTIDLWVKFNSIPSLNPFIGQVVDSAHKWMFYYAADEGNLKFYCEDGGSDVILFTTPWSPSINTWYHLALVRSSTSNWYIFVNGESKPLTLASGSWSASLPNFSGSIYAGFWSYIPYYLAGWIDEVRISKGVARWTSNFTPSDSEYGGSFSAQGAFTSSAIELNATELNTISWNETLPPDTDRTIQTRTGETLNPDDGTWSAWSSPITEPAGSNITSPPARYIQHKINLTTNNAAVTPQLIADTNGNFIRIGYVRSSGGSGLGSIYKKAPSWSVIRAGTGNAIKYIAVLPSDSNVIYAATWGEKLIKTENGGLTWTTLGPNLTDNNVNVVRVRRDDPLAVYIGTESDGIYKSVDAAANFVPISTGLANLSITALAIDPNDANVMYAGTQAGIYKTIDGGDNWLRIGESVVNNQVNSIAIDALNSNIICIGTETSGVYRSTTGGNDWVNVNNGLADLSVVSVIIDQKHLSQVWCATKTQGIFRMVLQNNPPQISGASISPLNAYENSTLQVSTVGWSDSDLDAEGYSYEWYNQSGVIAGAATGELTGTYFNKGDEVYCQVRPYDGFDYGDPIETNHIIIQNSLPAIDSASISPSVAYKTTPLVASGVNWSDADGDTAEYSYEWHNQTGVITGATSNTLSPSYFNKHDLIYCIVTPYDGEGYGTSQTTPTIEIQNSLPQVNLIRPDGGENWKGAHNIEWAASDVDTDTVLLSFYYQLAGGAWIPVASGEANDGTYEWNTSGLPDGFNSYLVKVTASDGEGEISDISTNPFTLNNEPPASPQNIGATSDGNYINVSWNRNSESDLAGYKVYYGSSPGNYTSVKDVPNPDAVSTQLLINDVRGTQGAGFGGMGPTSFVDGSGDLSSSTVPPEAYRQSSRPKGEEYVKDEIIIKIKGGNIPRSVRLLNTKFKARSVEKVFKEALGDSPAILAAKAASRSIPDLSGIYLVKLPKGSNVKDIIKEYQKDPNIEYAEPNYKVYALGGLQSEYYYIAVSSYDNMANESSYSNETSIEYLPPDDTYYRTSGTWGQSYPDMWGLAKINIQDAWSIEKGTSDIVVAVIDTGCDYNHEDLAGNIWTNTDEVPANGIDDDGNGYVDDVRGWDFIGANSDTPIQDDNPMDGHGHGTHVAGTIAAVTDNYKGVAGISWLSRIMPVKGLADDGGGPVTVLAQAIRYAADNGARVLNNSWGGFGDSLTIKNAIDYAHALDAVVVVAAGNENQDALYSNPSNCENAITVAAYDPNDEKAYFSNWGAKIDVAAPGVDILSLRATGTGSDYKAVGGKYYRMSGTSMACPHVAGLAALILSRNPGLTNEAVRQIVRASSADLNFEGRDDYSGFGRIDAYQALQINSISLARINSPAYNSHISGTIDITGTAQGANFVNYIIEYGRGDNPAEWFIDYITLSGGGMSPITDGVLGTLNTSGLDEGEWTIKLSVFDAGGVISEDYRTLTVDRSLHSNWPKNLEYNGSSSVVYADLDNNGTTEIILCTKTPDTSQGEIHVWNTSGAYLAGWPKSISSPVNSSPAIGDIDGDGDKEIVVAAYDPEYLTSPGIRQHIFAWHHDGSALSGWPKSNDYPSEWSSPVLADLNSDGALDMIVCGTKGGDGRIYAYKSDGTVISGWPIDVNGKFDSTPAVGDIDGDGEVEIVAATGGTDAKAYSWHKNGTPFSGWPRQLDGYGAQKSSPALGDIDLDGKNEVVVGITDEVGGAGQLGKVYVLDQDGTNITGWPKYTGDQYVESSPCLADLDNNGDIEIIVGSSYDDIGAIHIWRRDGTYLTGWPKDVTSAVSSSPAAADLDGDGRCEIIVGTGPVYCKIHIWDMNGTELNGWPKRVDSIVSTSAAIGDIDGDGNLELLLAPWGSKIYQWDLNGTFSEERLAWPMFHRNAQHTGSYPLPNYAPTLSTLPDKVLNEDTPIDNAIDLYQYADDRNNQDSELTFSIVNNTNPNCGASIDSNRYIDIAPAQNWNGASDVTVRVTDPKGLYAECTFHITVTPVNDPPVISPLVPNPAAVNEDSPIIIDLTSYEYDLEDTGTALNWTVSGLDKCVVSGENSADDILTFTPQENFYGQDVVTLILTDSNAVGTSQNIVLTWNPVNDAPVVSDIPNKTIAEGFSNSSIDLDDYVADVDNPDIQISWTYSGNTNIGVSINSQTHVVTLGSQAGWSGQETINFTANDPGGLTNSDTSVVTVDASPEPARVLISFEAEDMNSLDAGVTVATSQAAWATSYITSLAASGENRHMVYLPQTGEYAIWLRLSTDVTTTSALGCSMNGGPVFTVGYEVTENPPLFKWINWENNNPLARIRLTLPAGVNNLSLTLTEPNIKVDSIIITNDLNYIPPDTPPTVSLTDWIKIAQDGFGYSKNSESEIFSYNGSLYASITTKGWAPIPIYKLDKEGSFKKVADISSGTRYRQMYRTLDMEYISAQGLCIIMDDGFTGYVVKSADGVSWSSLKLGSGGAGWWTRDIIEFNGYCYVAFYDYTIGTFTMRRTRSENLMNNVWEDASLKGIDEGEIGTNHANNRFGASIVFKGALYIGTEDDLKRKGAQLYRTYNGTSWELVNTAGFGDRFNNLIGCMESFGDYLYVAIYSWSKAQNYIYRSRDGKNNWEYVYTISGSPIYNMNMLAYLGRLYVITSGNTHVYSALDGLNWERLTNQKLGDSVYFSFTSIEQFDGSIYVSTGGSQGTQVWKRDVE